MTPVMIVSICRLPAAQRVKRSRVRPCRSAAGTIPMVPCSNSRAEPICVLRVRNFALGMAHDPSSVAACICYLDGENRTIGTCMHARNTDRLASGTEMSGREVLN